MIRYFLKKLRFWQKAHRNLNKEAYTSKLPKGEISRDLRTNLNILKDIMGTSSDIIMREFAFGHQRQVKAAVVFIDGLTDKAVINESIIKPLMIDSRLICPEEKIRG